VVQLTVELQLLAAAIHRQTRNNPSSCCNSHPGDQTAQQQQQQQQQQQGDAAEAAVPDQQYVRLGHLLSQQCLVVGNRLLLQHVYEVVLQPHRAECLQPLLAGPDASLVQALAAPLREGLCECFEQREPSWSVGEQLFALAAALDACTSSEASAGESSWGAAGVGDT
jgi:hypothetical protein